MTLQNAELPTRKIVHHKEPPKLGKKINDQDEEIECIDKKRLLTWKLKRILSTENDHRINVLHLTCGMVPVFVSGL